MPLLYEIVSLRITGRQRIHAGWDGREYLHPSLSFLSWLLCNPSAPPRRYIRQLVFVHTDTFSPYEIRTDAPITDTDQLWAIDNLIVMYPSDMRGLRAAGIVAHKTHWVATVSRERSKESIGKDVLALANSVRDDNPRGRHCVRIWTKPVEVASDPSQEDRQAAAAGWSNAFRYHELGQDIPGAAVAMAPENECGVTIFIDVGAQDGFGQLSSVLLSEIASIFELDPQCAYQIVLVYPKDASDKLISAAVCRIRAEHASLRSRQEQLWIARSSLDRRLMVLKPQTAVARAFQLGIDPWEKGQCISEFSAEVTAQCDLPAS